MNIHFSKNVSMQIQEIADKTGTKEEEIVNNAVLLYLDNISKYITLKKELSALDRLSDDALLNFEASL